MPAMIVHTDLDKEELATKIEQKKKVAPIEYATCVTCPIFKTCRRRRLKGFNGRCDARPLTNKWTLIPPKTRRK